MARAVRQPTDAELADAGRKLFHALELAEQLPTTHERELRYPRLPRSKRPDVCS